MAEMMSGVFLGLGIRISNPRYSSIDPQSGWRFVNRLACRVNDCLLIAIVKDAHTCPLEEDFKHIGSV
jgi:hypothetical protein